MKVYFVATPNSVTKINHQFYKREPETVLRCGWGRDVGAGQLPRVSAYSSPRRDRLAAVSVQFTLLFAQPSIASLNCCIPLPSCRSLQSIHPWALTLHVALRLQLRHGGASTCFRSPSVIGAAVRGCELSSSQLFLNLAPLQTSTHAFRLRIYA